MGVYLVNEDDDAFSTTPIAKPVYKSNVNVNEMQRLREDISEIRNKIGISSSNELRQLREDIREIRTRMNSNGDGGGCSSSTSPPTVVSGQKVQEQIYDLQIRMKYLEAREKKYSSLIDRVKALEDMKKKRKMVDKDDDDGNEGSEEEEQESEHEQDDDYEPEQKPVRKSKRNAIRRKKKQMKKVFQKCLICYAFNQDKLKPRGHGGIHFQPKSGSYCKTCYVNTGTKIPIHPGKCFVKLDRRDMISYKPESDDYSDKCLVCLALGMSRKLGHCRVCFTRNMRENPKSYMSYLNGQHSKYRIQKKKKKEEEDDEVDEEVDDGEETEYEFQPLDPCPYFGENRCDTCAKYGMPRKNGHVDDCFTKDMRIYENFKNWMKDRNLKLKEEIKQLDDGIQEKIERTLEEQYEPPKNYAQANTIPTATATATAT